MAGNENIQMARRIAYCSLIHFLPFLHFRDRTALHRFQLSIVHPVRDYIPQCALQLAVFTGYQSETMGCLGHWSHDSETAEHPRARMQTWYQCARFQHSHELLELLPSHSPVDAKL